MSPLPLVFRSKSSLPSTSRTAPSSDPQACFMRLLTYSLYNQVTRRKPSTHRRETRSGSLLHLFVRASTDPRALAQPIREIVSAQDSDVSVSRNSKTLDDQFPAIASPHCLDSSRFIHCARAQRRAAREVLPARPPCLASVANARGPSPTLACAHRDAQWAVLTRIPRGRSIVPEKSQDAEPQSANSWRSNSKLGLDNSAPLP
jgi:hypothetical protein